MEREWTSITADELREICTAVVELTRIRQSGCSHLCVENFAPEIMRKMLYELQMYRIGYARAAILDTETRSD